MATLINLTLTDSLSNWLDKIRLGLHFDWSSVLGFLAAGESKLVGEIQFK